MTNVVRCGTLTRLASMVRNCVSPRTLLDNRLSTCPTCTLHRYYATKQQDTMNIFDRKAKRIQRNRTATLKNYEVYDYIKDEIGYRMADRICDVKRKFDVAVDLGCGRGHVSKNIYADMVGTLYQTDMAEMVLEQSAVSPEVPTYKLHVDEEFLPFPDNSIDLFISSLSLHWVNNLPGTFKQVNTALKNDGCFMGAMFGGDTLFELRVALQQAETQKQGGFAAHISPFVTAQDIGALLTSAGFVMLTIDSDEIVVNFPSMFKLMADLKGMGENNCAWNRRPMIYRDTLQAAADIYKEMYGSPDEDGVPATFQFVNFIAWKPDKSQKGPVERGSGQVSLKDLDKLDKIAKEIEDVKTSQKPTDVASGPSPDWDKSADKLGEDLERLRKHTMEQLDTDSDTNDKDKKQ